ncbi:hypothetical protein NDS46_22440 [Paenibacillus thiaminolyticus]|uniref:hypothetical protein n=1 Tax=Paenibacillus thiaminolyticus TaxID=49283 RepID=UPI002330DAD3|nr:hypothetical protein [Paenibacillus thiaminolyticus]WCF07068.1 hypothetical protein NDS46_22440 [Paenibacillus thiaminolyticus]
MQSVSVHIDASTSKVQRVKIAPKKANPKENTVTSKQVAGIAKPVIKDVLGVDISSYSQNYNKGLGEYQFSSKGKRTVRVKVTPQRHVYDIQLGSVHKPQSKSIITG